MSALTRLTRVGEIECGIGLVKAAPCTLNPEGFHNRLSVMVGFCQRLWTRSSWFRSALSGTSDILKPPTAQLRLTQLGDESSVWPRLLIRDPLRSPV